MPAVYVAVKELEDLTFRQPETASDKHLVSQSCEQAKTVPTDGRNHWNSTLMPTAKARLEVEIKNQRQASISTTNAAAVLARKRRRIFPTRLSAEKVRDYQAAGISFMLNAIAAITSLKSGVILADQVGLGKTFQSNARCARCFQKAFSGASRLICPLVSLRRRSGSKKRRRMFALKCQESWAKTGFVAVYRSSPMECHFALGHQSQQNEGHIKAHASAVLCLPLPGLGSTDARQRPKNIFPVFATIRHRLGKNHRKDLRTLTAIADCDNQTDADSGM